MYISETIRNFSIECLPGFQAEGFIKKPQNLNVSILLGDYINFCGLLGIHELYHGQHTQINLIYNDHALDLYLHNFGYFSLLDAFGPLLFCFE